jgi:arginine decarboxylase
MNQLPIFDRSAFPILISVGAGLLQRADETLNRLANELQALGHETVFSSSPSDALALVKSDPSFGCFLLDWNMDLMDGVRPAEEIALAIRQRHSSTPVFLFVDRVDIEKIPLDIAEIVQEEVILFEDTPAFIAGRIDFAWRRHTDNLLPPFFQSLVTFADSHEYSWHTPGHAGGTAFRKSQVGKAFYDFYGENIFQTDLSVSIAELGSLLDHSGTVGVAERNAARIFGATTTYFVLNGTSTANQIVAHSCVIAGDVVLADRNCHKSVNYALAITDALPVYLVPTRNGFGIIGPIPRQRLTKESIAKEIAANPLSKKGVALDAVYAVVTNSTYDGLCYRADYVIDALQASVPRIHFDEAWFAYARFHPIFRNRFAMHDRTSNTNDPTIFATQSTHKLLAAFSQASMIHVRPSERAPVVPSRFNEAYMMHGSTSPFYPMIACLDVAAAMMDGDNGQILIADTIREAVLFRKRVVSVGHELAASEKDGEGWFFGVWQPDEVRDPTSGLTSSFCDAPLQLLENEPSCWVLHADKNWHGFGDLGDDYCMLDPTKVTITTPGANVTGELALMGIPAPILSSFLDNRRIEVEKTGDYTLLVLFSMGTTIGKSGTLLEGLLAFKRAYDNGQLLSETMPDLASSYSPRYANYTLKQLCDEMHEEVLRHDTLKLLDGAFDETPVPIMTPGDAYRRLVRGHSERLTLAKMANRASTVMVVPYPPGIPLLMPGENAGPADGPILRYLSALETFDKNFPGFSHDIHGVERDDEGNFFIECLVED